MSTPLLTVLAKLRAAEARVAELEAALREVRAEVLLEQKESLQMRQEGLRGCLHPEDTSQDRENDVVQAQIDLCEEQIVHIDDQLIGMGLVDAE